MAARCSSGHPRGAWVRQTGLGGNLGLGVLGFAHSPWGLGFSLVAAAFGPGIAHTSLLPASRMIHSPKSLLVP